MQKILLVSVVLLFITATLAAQVEKGNIYPAFTAGKHLTRTNKNNMIQPSVEVGISQHSTLGIFYSYNRFEPGIIAGYNALGIKQGAGISYNYYRHFSKGGKWGWYMNSTVGIYDNKIVNRHSGSSYLLNRHRSGELTLTPGVFFSPIQRVMLFADPGGIAISSTKHDKADFRHNLLDRLSFGIRFTLKGKKSNAVRAQ